MPVRPITKNGKTIGYRWGKTGKLYTIKKYGKRKAKTLSQKQAKAIYASGYKKIRRARPHQHKRRLKRKTITVNKGIKKKNYGGGPFFHQYLQNKGTTFKGTKKEKKLYRHLLEKRPEIIKDMLKNRPVTIINKKVFQSSLRKVNGDTSLPTGLIIHGKKINKKCYPNIIALNEELALTELGKYWRQAGKDMPEKILAHEVGHIKQRREVGDKKFTELLNEKVPHDFQQTEIYARKYANRTPERKIHVAESIRKKAFRKLFGGD